MTVVHGSGVSILVNRSSDWEEKNGKKKNQKFFDFRKAEVEKCIDLFGNLIFAERSIDSWE